MIEAHASTDGIAIVGMAGRFPGAHNLEQFWHNLKNGVESISVFSEEELQAAGVDAAMMKIPGFVNAGSVLDDVDLFDGTFFGFSPRDAETTDPQQRLFLECAWEGLENAGYCPDTYPGLISIFGGSDQSTYIYQIYANSERLATLDLGMVGIGNDKDYLTTLVSYKLNLRGPSVAVQTACSTSLVAVCLACQTLWSYQCDMALAGGVAVNVPQKKGYFYQPGGIVSPDGHCRTFDASGQGTVVGNGVSMVVLKRLSDALADGDNIRAIIRGTGLNNDGAMKVGFGAPSVEGQAQAIAMAHAIAGANPDSISYVEAHGTATLLGDPIEFAALNQVFSPNTKRKQFCAIGSLKSNVGHLSSAAGAAGLIKTVLALENEAIPPSLHFERPNPQINFADSPFYVNTKLSEWKRNDRPRWAGVSSFGVGGTNAHVVLEEGPNIESEPSTRPAQLLVLSAKSAQALEVSIERLATHLDQHPETNLADLAYTLQVGRKAFSNRCILVCRELEEACNVLRSRDSERIRTAAVESRDQPVVFMFSGQGSQYAGMGRQLYETEPVFREELERCFEILKQHVNFSLHDLLYPPPEFAGVAEENLRDTSVAQPALFAIEYALAKLWVSCGVYPQGMVGHSIGEYTAACLAGVFSLEDALKLVALRGRLMSQMPQGTMLAVPLSEADVQPYLNAAVSLAAVNAPSLSVLSGPTEAIESIAGHFTARGLQCRPLHTSHAFHSSMMDPVVWPFIEAMEQVKMNAPQIPYLSNLTGTWITPEEATSAGYWGKHLRQTVRFSKSIEELARVPHLVLLEVGPGQALTTLARMHATAGSSQAIVSCMRSAQQTVSDCEHILMTLGQLWLHGLEPKWSGLHAPERRRRIPLPTYPFERRRYWIGLPEHARAEAVTPPRQVSDWFYVPSWKPDAAQTATKAPTAPLRWLIFSNEDELSREVIERLRNSGSEVYCAAAGDTFAKNEGGMYSMRPSQQEDYQTLIHDLRAAGILPNCILHLWNTGAELATLDGLERFDSAQIRGFYSVVFLAQALEKNNVTSRIQLGFVTSGLHSLLGDEPLFPERAPVLGALKVIPQELTNLRCRNIDVTLPAVGEYGNRKLAGLLIREMSQEAFEPVVAYRKERRWIQIYDPVPLQQPGTVPPPLLKERGVYVITGGLGNIGLAFAQYLANAVQARLVLIGRTHLPERSEWERWLSTHAGDDISRKIRSIVDIENAGAEVLAISADSGNGQQMFAAIEQARNRFGRIDGVIHGAGNTSADGVFPLGQVDVAAGARQFMPKAHGLLILEELLRDDKIDFWLLLSSLSGVLGGLGLIAYSAANIFLDAYAVQRNGQGATPWISVNWDAWKFHDGLAAGGQTEFISPAAGVDALERIFASAPHQVVVAVSDLHARLKKWVYLDALQEQPVVQKAQAAPVHPRPNLSSTYIEPKTDVEKTIAGIWQQVLGIAPIGVHDKFFELGGHSLLAIQLISQLREAFQVEIPAQRLFEAPTIAQLAESIEVSLHAQAQEKESDEERLAQMLELVESMSEEEVARLLADPQALRKVTSA
jgi:acyl transferase domain-containing protein